MTLLFYVGLVLNGTVFYLLRHIPLDFTFAAALTCDATNRSNYLITVGLLCSVKKAACKDIVRFYAGVSAVFFLLFFFGIDDDYSSSIVHLF